MLEKIAWEVVCSPGKDGDPDPLPILAGKTLVDGEAAVYVCKDFACQAPATDAHGLRAVLLAAPTR